MNYRITLLIFFLLPLSFSFSEDVIIKSLRVYSSNDETLLPVISEGSNITIEFDIESEFEPNLNIIFRFCDKDWNPTDNIFLTNLGKNTAYFLELKTLPTTVENAKYHFKDIFPGNYL